VLPAAGAGRYPPPHPRLTAASTDTGLPAPPVEERHACTAARTVRGRDLTTSLASVHPICRCLDVAWRGTSAPHTSSLVLS